MPISVIQFKGQELPLTPVANVTGEGLTLVKSFLVGNTVRGLNAKSTDISLSDDHVVEFIFDDATTWLCGNDSLEELFPEATLMQSRSGEAVFRLPSTLQPPAGDRGFTTGIGIKIVNIFVKKEIEEDINEAVIAAAKNLEEHMLASRIGLFCVDNQFILQDYKPGRAGKPYLLFLHGTASSTEGSFDGMKDSSLWNYITQHYDGNVLAFQHASLTKSPLCNIYELLTQLPDELDLHLISHSRGGLLGEILCRIAGNNGNLHGFTEKHKSLLKAEGNTKDLEYLEKIEALMSAKKITIGKFIRVACPASGTILASKRLDNVLNIIANLIGAGAGIAASPLYSLFKTLISTVINTKNDPSVLPGIEAMIPDSPLIRIINDPAIPALIDTPLVVISGNCRAKVNFKALTIIASKLFFLRDNDLIVNTGSMYQGARRSGELQYFLDHNTDVDHFSYFRNKRTQELILAALQYEGSGAIPGFSYMSETEALALRNALLQLEGGKLFLDQVSGKRPIVVLLPGIMGSNLDVAGDSTWINYLKFLTGGLKKLDIGNDHITAPSIVASSYRKLAEYLAPVYDVVTFPFDWRRSLVEAAGLLDVKMKELLSYNLPIKIIGHSMGGVLVRDFMAYHPETWKSLTAHKDFRLLFLGAPLGGSHRILNVLFGADPIISKISKVDLWHSKRALVGIFAQFPGLLSLLPIMDDKENDFADAAVWNNIRDAFGDQSWILPDSKSLGYFKGYKAGLSSNAANINYDKAVYIAGKDDATPCGYRIVPKKGGSEVVFYSTAQGDQSVTWASGIPKAMRANDTVYYAPVTHGMLANEPSIFKAITEILAQGSTRLIPKQPPAVRGDELIFKTPEIHDFDLSPNGLEDSILGLNGYTPEVEQSATLKVSISNGDLFYAAHPVLAGHFAGDGILYAEKAIDNLVFNALTQKHVLGIYPGIIGTSEVVLIRSAEHEDAAFQGAIIAGLGEVGKLTAYQLALTTEQAVANYLLTIDRDKVFMPDASDLQNRVLGISSLIIGCGYGGLTVENAMRAIIQGVQAPNRKIRKLKATDQLMIGRLEFVEKYADTALDGFYALQRLADENNGTLKINISEAGSIKYLFGMEKRLSSSQVSQWWNRINVRLIDRATNDDDNTKKDKLKCMQFSASTGGAREEQRMVYSSVELLKGMVAEISTENTWSSDYAKIIFELLIPNDFKEQFKKQININWILDKDTASYPWELLHDGSADTLPLAVNAGMIRQLATENYRLIINAVTSKTALVIAEPQLHGMLPALPGALREGARVNSLLNDQGFSVSYCPNSTFIEITRSLFARDYKIIHLAGHGVFNPDHPESSGMAIGPDIFLSTREISQMSTVPELVFINCCYLGHTSGNDERLYQNRYKLAANLGTQLIENGVKAVVAAGWAVNDEAALDFTSSFYEHMFLGYTFGEAIRKARETIYYKYPKTNTWGAYQCYGDPFYKLTSEDFAQASREYKFKTAQEAGIELFNLFNELEMPGKSVAAHLERLIAITEGVEKAGVRDANITEQEAFIYAELADYGNAIAKFEELLVTEKASFSLSSVEKFCNWRSKYYILQYFQHKEKRTALLRKMDLAISDLMHLIALGVTAERYNLLGSIYKRRSILSTGNERIKSLKNAAYYYRMAWTIDAKYYPYTSWIQIESLLVGEGREWGAKLEQEGELFKYKLPTAEEIDRELSQYLTAVNGRSQVVDYWDLVAQANVKLCSLLVYPEKAEAEEAGKEIATILRKLWVKAGSPGKKSAEREHLDFLVEMLGNFPEKDTIRASIMELRKVLSS